MNDAPTSPTKLGHSDHRVLICLSEQGGWTAGEVTRQMGYSNVRSEAQLLRCVLLRMEIVGWVARLDDKKPVAHFREVVNGE